MQGAVIFVRRGFALGCALRSLVAPVVLTAGLFSMGGTVRAQELLPQDPKAAKDAAPSQKLLNVDETDPASAPYKPITLKQKYEYSLEQMFSGPHLIAILAHASIDQARVVPYAWGSNAPAFGVRVTSDFGRSFVRATVASGIRGLDHEDPRYFYSHKKRPWERAKYAVVHTFEVHNDNGSMMPAYSRFIGDFGIPFLAQTWRPGGVNPPDALRSGAIGIGMGMGMSIAQEFWPDVKHALHLGPGTAGLISPGTIH